MFRSLRLFAALLLTAWWCPAVASADDFPPPYDSETDLSAKRLSPAEAAAQFRLPPGFRVDVFAAEPEVANPIAAAWDRRGRLWIAENYTYAERPKKFDLSLRDRILIFADRDGDGRPESRHVFLEDAQRLTSIEVGLGGVWLMCPPQLLFVPDRNQDDVPDGPAEVVLEGFKVPPENYHNFANGLKWGPDGWLYGRCGASAPGLIRRADAPDAFVVPLRGGLWRYQPQRRTFEALCHGTTNPWGHDWDRDGEAFFINTVNGHLWHLIPGAHLRRPHTLNANPLVYEPIEMHADHWHWDTGKTWSDSRSATGEHDRRGGGHAHIGMTIYLGQQWPAPYQGRLFTLNQHGRRMNVERLERAASGYVGRHEPDILHAADPWFRAVEVTYGPDGSVFVLDWSDTGECHENTGVHRTSGRIYRVTYGNPRPVPAPDLTQLAPPALVALQRDQNEWLARAARRELADRSARAAGRAAASPGDASLAPALAELQQILMTPGARTPRLRALWSLQTALGDVPQADLLALLSDPDEHLRTWAVRLLTDRWPLDTALGDSRAEATSVAGELLDRFVNQARTDASGLVRLALASTLQRLPVAQRPKLAAALLARAEDADDHNLPALVWHGLIPVARQAPAALAELGAAAQWPACRQWAARYLTEIAAQRPQPLDRLLALTRQAPEAVRTDILAGVVAGLAGQRQVTPPPNWPHWSAAVAAQASPAVQEQLRGANVVFGDGRALTEVRQLVLDGKADLVQRRAALESFIAAEPPDLREVCEQLLKVRFLNTVALQGLTRFGDPTIGRRVAAAYSTFHASERPAVIEALVARPSFALALLDEVAAGKIPRGDISAVQARQMRTLGNPAVAARLTEIWGELRDTPQDRLELIARLKQELAPARLQQADASNGRAVFVKSCANCHRLFGAGGEVGPDLTGSGRKNLDYLLSNIVDPSAVVARDFQLTVLTLKDGRVISGVILHETEQTLTVQTAQNRVALPRSDVEDRTLSRQSLMPDGLLQPLSADQIRDLIAYLMADAQAPLPAP